MGKNVNISLSFLEKFSLPERCHKFCRNKSTWNGVFRFPKPSESIGTLCGKLFFKVLIHSSAFPVFSSKRQNAVLSGIHKFWFKKISRTSAPLGLHNLFCISLTFTDQWLWIWQRDELLDLVFQDLDHAGTWLYVSLVLCRLSESGL